jgi:CBS domain-containing protein
VSINPDDQDSDYGRSKILNTSNLTKFTGDGDYQSVPATVNVLDWWHFNVDYWSSQRAFSEITDICARFGHKKIDLRPYMIEAPYIVHSTDKLPKVLEMFRHFHLRALPVLEPSNGLLIAVLTR